MPRLGRRRPAKRGILERAAVDRDQDLRLSPVARVAARHDREQRLRVRVLQIPHDCFRRAFLDYAAEVDDRDPLREAGRRREVVGGSGIPYVRFA